MAGEWSGQTKFYVEPNVFAYPSGSAIRERVTVLDATGAPVAFAGTETLALQVTRGDDTAAITMAGATATWATAAAGTIDLAWLTTDTAGLAAGDYPIYLAIGSGTTLARRRIGTLRLLPAPGSATLGAVYCTFADLLDEAGDLAADLQEHQSDRAGFADVRARAREEFDRLIQAHYRGTGYYRQDSLDHLLDGVPTYRHGGDDATLQGWLDDDGLILTGPTGKAIVRWNALHSLHLIYRRSRNDGYREQAAAWRAECDAIAAGLTVGIDTTDPLDGTADVYVSLGVVDCMRQ